MEFDFYDNVFHNSETPSSEFSPPPPPIPQERIIPVYAYQRFPIGEEINETTPPFVT